MAHRLFYEARYGPIEDGNQLHHRCGIPSCVNPDHLLPLSVAEHARLHWESA
ncbi:HNH endonuclease signature motif containing protein [Rubrobacter marinus]